MVAVEVRHATTLAANGRSRGGGGGSDEEEEARKRWTDIKPNNPHLTGGIWGILFSVLINLTACVFCTSGDLRLFSDSVTLDALELNFDTIVMGCVEIMSCCTLHNFACPPPPTKTKKHRNRNLRFLSCCDLSKKVIVVQWYSFNILKMTCSGFKCFLWSPPWGKDSICFANIWVFPRMRGTPKWMVYNGNPIKMDDLGVPLFSETSISQWVVKTRPTQRCSLCPWYSSFGGLLGLTRGDRGAIGGPSLVTSGFLWDFLCADNLLHSGYLTCPWKRSYHSKKGFQGCIWIYDKPTVNRIWIWSNLLEFLNSLSETM